MCPNSTTNSDSIHSTPTRNSINLASPSKLEDISPISFGNLDLDQNPTTNDVMFNSVMSFLSQSKRVFLTTPASCLIDMNKYHKPKPVKKIPLSILETVDCAEDSKVAQDIKVSLNSAFDEVA